MCGIVGILGTRPVAERIVESLKRLEYRGYDSAGVAVLEHGDLTRRRAEGKLKNLEASLDRAPLTGTAGIGQDHAFDVDHQDHVVGAVDAVDVFRGVNRTIAAGRSCRAADGGGTSCDERKERDGGEEDAEWGNDRSGDGSSQELAITEVRTILLWHRRVSS